VAEELLGRLVEARSLPAGQQLGEAGDHLHGGAQVVGGVGGEAGQLPVGLLELGRSVLQLGAAAGQILDELVVAEGATGE
jgi:hypothetical protein